MGELGCWWDPREHLGQAELPGSKPLAGTSCHVPFTLNENQARPWCDTADLLLTSALERGTSVSAGLCWLAVSRDEGGLLQVR